MNARLNFCGSEDFNGAESILACNQAEPHAASQHSLKQLVYSQGRVEEDMLPPDRGQ